jgi:hypothetical protein
VFSGRLNRNSTGAVYYLHIKIISFIKLAVSYLIISVRVKEVDVEACKCRRSCKILHNIVTCLPFVWFYALLDLFTAHIQDMGRQETFMWRSAVLLLKLICSVRHLTLHSI